METLTEDTLGLLAALGGFEVVHIVGAMLSAAEQQMVVLVDGFICTAAALVAIAINPNVKAYFIFTHNSNEQGHSKMLAHLEVKPLLQLALRLGDRVAVEDKVVLVANLENHLIGERPESAGIEVVKKRLSVSLQRVRIVLIAHGRQDDRHGVVIGDCDLENAVKIRAIAQCCRIKQAFMLEAVKVCVLF